MKKILLFGLFLFCISVTAQKTNPWKISDRTEIATQPKVNRSSFPKNYQILNLNLEAFKSQLVGAPVRGRSQNRSNQEILLPNADGKIERFYVMETPIMEDELAAKFPMIKSYAAQGIDDPTAVARFSVTQFGLHSMTMTAGKSTVFIDPYTEDRANYIVYSKSDLERNSDTNFECLTDDVRLPSLETDRNVSNYSVFNTDDNTLRTYRLAQSCTAEYGNIFAGTGTLAQQKANIQAQMAITMTRVNGVYEIDLAITMIFVANNDAIIYLGSVTADPWSNEWNTKTAQTIDAVIGVSNYDIGHNFNTTGGGNAGCIACVCKSTSQTAEHKGRGYTGRSNPTGDAFDIDYVAHEMGHQFGGYHTQSSSGCRSGSGLTEVEPGSASTIMGYAGICAANVQSNSDAYFGYVNIRDIMNYVKTTSGSCSVNTPIANQTPFVNAGLDYTIPKSTAFILTATGSDPDNDVLTYTWEENDPENPNTTAAPTSTRAAGPMFRSVWGTTSPSRYFPALATVLTGATSNTWEVVPSIARNLNFSVVARDNIAGGGQTRSDLMQVVVSGVAGPFVVNSPNTNVSWATGSNQTVTWNVAGTTANNVNAANVDIYISTNGGTSFDTLLASNVPNDGSEIVTIPNTVGTQNRIMVRGNNHIFYDVSNTNFTTTSGGATFAIAYDGTIQGQHKIVCQGADASFNFKYDTLNGFSANTNLSVSGNPVGTTATLSTSSINTTGIISLTVSNTTSATPGVYMITVSGTSGATTKTVNLYLEVLNSTFSTLSLTNPVDNAYAQNTSLTLQWNADAAATAYDLQLATDVDFTNIIVNTTVPTNSFLATGLTEYQNYFWKVQPKNSGCQGQYSNVNRFTTGQVTCANFASTNIPITISATGTPTVNSTLTIPTGSNVTISKITVSLNITHTWISDLTAILISPTGTQVQLFTGQCGSDDNAIATFDDNGVTLVCAGNPTTISGTVKPSQLLSLLNGQNSQGTWTLRVIDSATGDGGTINSWSLNICTVPNTPVPCGQITTTWNGTGWSNGFPVNNVAVIIDGDFTSDRDIEACSLTINNTSNVTLTSGDNFIIDNAVTVANTANFTIQNNANLIQINDVANTGNIKLYRDTNPLMRLDYVIWSSPVTGTQTLKQFSPATLNNRFYNYNTTTNLYNAVANPVTTPFTIGKGQLIRMPDNHPATPTIWTGEFLGNPNNGAIDVNLTYISNTQAYNMIGNPYPSTIDADAFLTNNASNINGTLYFWRKTNNAAGTAYATYTLGGATTTSPTSPTPNGIIQAGQGFIVEAKNTGSPIAAFTNSLRVANNANQFFRTNSTVATVPLERHRFWLNLTRTSGYFSQLMVGYMTSATIDFDEALDGKYINDSPIALTSLIGIDEYSIQGRPLPFDNTDVVPLKFKTNVSDSFTISLDHLDGLFADNQDVFLRDNILNIVTNLKLSEYTFTTDIGEFNTRFDVIYQDTALANSTFDSANSIQVVTNNNQIHVKSSNEPIEKVIVYDILGRTLLTKNNVSNNLCSISEIVANRQTLLLKIILEDGTTEVKKIIF